MESLETRELWETNHWQFPGSSILEWFPSRGFLGSETFQNTHRRRPDSDSERTVRGNPRDGIQARGGTKHHWKCSCSNESWGWCRGSDDHICPLIKYINSILDIRVYFTRSSREIKVNSDLALLILRRICAMGFYQGFAGFVSPITRLDSCLS